MSTSTQDTDAVLARKRVRRAGRRRTLIEDKIRSEMEVIYKPLEEWTPEELARGRPRAKDGTWRGKTNGWLTPTVKEQAAKHFGEWMKDELAVIAVDALRTLAQFVEDDEVPAGVRLAATNLVIEHVLGKPKQQVNVDISARLQAILGAAMVNPQEAAALPAEVIDAEVEDDEN